VYSFITIGWMAIKDPHILSKFSRTEDFSVLSEHSSLSNIFLEWSVAIFCLYSSFMDLIKKKSILVSKL
jgi:hypothetical protein